MNILVICSIFFIKMNLIAAFRFTHKISNLNHQSRYKYHSTKGLMASKSNLKSDITALTETK